MTTLATLLQRNHDFAAQQFAADASRMPSLANVLDNLKALIIGCADPRVDPYHVLGLEPGEAVVLRNIGGRITPRTFQQMGLLNRIAEVAGGNPTGEFTLILLQHTDCGITRLANDPEMLAHYFEIDQADLPVKAVTDPRAAVTADVAALQANTALPDWWLVTGLVYDVATGLIDVVVPPAPLHDATA